MRAPRPVNSTATPRGASPRREVTPARSVSTVRAMGTPLALPASCLTIGPPRQRRRGGYRCCRATPGMNGSRAEPLHTLTPLLHRAPRRGATQPARRANGAPLSTAPLKQRGERSAVIVSGLPCANAVGAWVGGSTDHRRTVRNGSPAVVEPRVRAPQENDKRSPAASRMTFGSPGRPPPAHASLVTTHNASASERRAAAPRVAHPKPRRRARESRVILGDKDQRAVHVRPHQWRCELRDLLQVDLGLRGCGGGRNVVRRSHNACEVL